MSARAGTRIWVPEVEKFLEQIGLPHKPSVTVGDVPRPAKTDFAKLDDLAAVPYLRDSGRKGYGTFLEKGLPRAFAIGPAGAWGYAFEGDDPTARALTNCQKRSKDPCRLYAVDDDVVWQP